MTLSLIELKAGQKGKIVAIQGGRGMVTRLENMGIRANKKITKISAQFWRGPQIIKIDNLQLAIGFGAASRILVEIEK